MPARICLSEQFFLDAFFAPIAILCPRRNLIRSMPGRLRRPNSISRRECDRGLFRRREKWLTKKDTSVHTSRARARFPKAKNTAVTTAGQRAAKRSRSPASAITKPAGRKGDNPFLRCDTTELSVKLKTILKWCLASWGSNFDGPAAAHGGSDAAILAARIVRELSRSKSNSACGPPIRPANKEAIL
jgi:hypothetical protein